MGKHRRFFLFGLGSLLGCGLVALLWNTRPQLEDHKILRPWQGRVVFVKDSEKREDGSWDRIRIMEDPGWHTYVRLEETMIKTPRHRGSQVLARRPMSAERIQCQIPSSHMAESLAWIQSEAPYALPEDALSISSSIAPETAFFWIPCRPEADDVGYWLAKDNANPFSICFLPEAIEDPTAR